MTGNRKYCFLPSLIRTSGLAGKLLLFFFFVSVLSPVLCGDIPLVRFCNGKLDFPFLSSANVYQEHEDCFTIKPLVPFSAGSSDPLNEDLKGPFDRQVMKTDEGGLAEADFRHRHWLGTNVRGSDVLAGIVHGTGISFFVAIFGTIVALFIGTTAGFISGWWTNRSTQWNVAYVILFLAVTIFAWNAIMTGAGFIKTTLISTVLAVLMYLFLKMLIRKRLLPICNLTITPDTYMFSAMVLFSTIPRILLVLTLGLIIPSSIYGMVLLLGITGWVDIARNVRTETSRIRNTNFMEAAKMSGAGLFRILISHVLPNIWPSLLVICLFTTAGNVLAESSLSFIGFGLPPETVSLGSIMAEGKYYPEAWWLTVFPGIWISIFIMTLFSVSRIYRLRTIGISEG